MATLSTDTPPQDLLERAVQLPRPQRVVFFVYRMLLYWRLP
jgi:hypothetical protein